jgi:hypothetical protein
MWMAETVTSAAPAPRTESGVAAICPMVHSRCRLGVILTQIKHQEGYDALAVVR